MGITHENRNAGSMNTSWLPH